MEESFKVPPHSIEAEQSVLGGLMLDNEAWMQIADRIGEQDLYRRDHRLIFLSIKTLAEESQPCDVITLSEWLAKRGQLDAAGGLAYLGELAKNTPSAANITTYADIVRENSILRQLTRVGTDIANSAYSPEGRGTAELLDHAEKEVFAIAEQNSRQAGFIPIKHLLVTAVDRIDTLFHQESPITGLSTGFKDFDELTSGLQASDLIIVAGRPSMGKCCEKTTEIVLADGSIASIEEICRCREAQLLTLGNDWRFRLTAPDAFVDDGIKPVFRIATRLGRFVKTTLTHPYLLRDGWKPLAEISAGDKIAVPRKIDIFGTEKIRECEVKLSAYLLGDTEGVRIPRVQKEFNEVAAEFGDAAAQSKLTGNPREKSIPSLIFRLQRPLLALFLNRLFAADGGQTVAEQAEIVCTCKSERLARQVQHLLLRFGIIAALKELHSPHGSRKPLWQVNIAEALSIRIFIDEIGIFAREEVLSKARIAAVSAGQSEYAEGAPTPDSEIYWDEIVSIEPLGNKQVYDLTIPETHNFVANDICVHNTSFAMNIAEHAAIHEKKPVAVFSMEMPGEQLAMRLMSSLGRIDQHKVRTGKLDDDDWPRLTSAISMLAETPLFIDDSPALSPTDIRARARRLAREQGELGLIVIDYLQLMQVPGNKENRATEVAEISRALKALAKELGVPLVALSQLNRSLEQRPNKRPIMSDLRECVTGDTLVMLEDGSRVPISRLVGQTPRLISVTADGQLEPAASDLVWSVGKKPLFCLRLASGRTLRCTGKHRLRILEGWKQCDEFQIGDRIALARRLPEPVPARPWPEHEIILLAHLIGHGSYIAHQPLRYTTASEENSHAVTQAAQAFGSIVNRRPGRGNWHQLVIGDNDNPWHSKVVGNWLKDLQIIGQRPREKRVPAAVFQLPDAQLALFLRHLWATGGSIAVDENDKLQIDFSPASEQLVRDVAALLLRFGIIAHIQHIVTADSEARFVANVSGADQQRIFLHQIGIFGPHAEQADKLVAKLNHTTANTSVDCNDLFWDRIVAIEPGGEEEVFDLSVPGNACWLADGIVSHNSGGLEQDADLITFIYRDEVYNEDSEEKGTAEIIIAKQRNGPIGTTRLTFLGQYTRFENFASETLSYE
ncbi:MAG: replicative DNA helicase [Gammaproteobacteria bacterium]|nr:replicative DNA helicase [Gammaproteobacteria bacterium]